jgi:hypothetical protein
VGDLGVWEGDVWVWDLRWRRPLFVWEVDQLSELLSVAFRQSKVDRVDRWSWPFSSDGVFSVKSAYSHLIKNSPSIGASNDVLLQAISKVWKSSAPSKVVVFSWQLLLNKVPTRRNLQRCGVTLPDGDFGCVLCHEPTKSAVHLFIVCPESFSVWYQVSRWLGWDFVSPQDLPQHFLAFTGLGRGKKVRLGLLLVWHAVIWTIWMSRNDLIFSGGTLREEPVVDRVKLLAWKWFLAKCPAISCTYHQWEV